MSASARFCRRVQPTKRSLTVVGRHTRPGFATRHGRFTQNASTVFAGVLQHGRLKPTHLAVQSRQQTHEHGVKEDTIYALSTATGAAAIAVIRISGEACRQIYHALCPNKPFPKARYATLRTLYEPSRSGDADTVLDPGALLLFFPSPNTVTGEDVLELHVHGGPATVKAVLSAIPKCSASCTVRYAEPGEFTRRAFLNARLSLPQVEALSATLTAQTEQQRKIAARGSTSALSDVYESWRVQLLQARAELEALIDFAEDQHFDESPRELAANVARMVMGLREHIDAHRENAVRGELLRDGISVALLGAPNAGKSSLLNRVVGREAAIVSREAGTTRDVVEVAVDLDGWLVRIGDTAGLRGQDPTVGEAAEVGEVEREGIRRAKDRAATADVVVVLFPIEIASKGNHGVELVMDAQVVETAKACLAQGRSVLVAINKIDKAATRVGHLPSQLMAKWVRTIQSTLSIRLDQVFTVSCTAPPSPSMQPTKVGTQSFRGHDPGNIQQLLHGLTRTFSRLTQPITADRAILSDPATTGPSEEHLLPNTSIWQDSLGASQRQRLLLEDCLEHLGVFMSHANQNIAGVDNFKDTDKEDDLDIAAAAESLRAAAEALAKITGRGESSDVEEVLGIVFEKFCVGK